MDFTLFFSFALICIAIFYAIHVGKIAKQYKQNSAENWTPPGYTTEIKTEFETVKVQAEVIDLSYRIDVKGIKMPKSVMVFSVTFQTDDKQIIKIDIPKEMYDGLAIGQKGEVTLVEGELYSFII